MAGTCEDERKQDCGIRTGDCDSAGRDKSYKIGGAL
jgi:hypothetical protein